MPAKKKTTTTTKKKTTPTKKKATPKSSAEEHCYFEAADEKAIMPQRATKYSAGYDFYAIEHEIIPPNQMKRIDTGIKVKLPEGFFLLIANRSSNPSKKGLMLANGVGVIDKDYYDTPCTIQFEFYNITKSPVVIQPGEKLGQGIIAHKFLTSDDKATGKRNGGFGSTGR